MTMGDRLQYIRGKSSQEEFGARIGVSKFAISGYENGKRTITDRVVSDVCREFNVRKEWMENGEGEPFKENPISLDEHARINDLDKTEIEIMKIIMEIPKIHRTEIISKMKNLFASKKSLSEEQADAMAEEKPENQNEEERINP